MSDELKTKAYVLRRTNYGEADRILNLITPEGKISAIAKGVRKSKSKLAGGIEMFSLVQMNLHFGKGELAVVTSTKMIEFFGEILKDLNKMELATMILKKVNAASDSVDSADFFMIMDKCLRELNRSNDLKLVEAWFLFNFARATGEDVNLYFDCDGQKLAPGSLYSWDAMNKSLVLDKNGLIDTNTIKIMRLLISVDFEIIKRINGLSEYLSEILKIARSL